MSRKALSELWISGGCLIALFWQSSAQGGIIYSKAIYTGATQNTTTACNGAERCFFKTGQGDAQNGVAVTLDGFTTTWGGQIPDKISATFKVKAAEKTAITDALGYALLSISASRDIGQRQATNDGGVVITYDDPVDWVATSAKTIGGLDTPLRDMFKGTLSTCPPGETSSGAACGPNYHSDFIISSDSMRVAQSDFLNFMRPIGDGDFKIELTLDPTDDVGRLKVFSVGWIYATPEPVTLQLLAVGALAVRTRSRRRRAA